MPYLIGVLVCAVFILPIGLATFVLEIVVAVKGLATKKKVEITLFTSYF